MRPFPPQAYELGIPESTIRIPNVSTSDPVFHVFLETVGIPAYANPALLWATLRNVSRKILREILQSAAGMARKQQRNEITLSDIATAWNLFGTQHYGLLAQHASRPILMTVEDVSTTALHCLDINVTTIHDTT